MSDILVEVEEFTANVVVPEDGDPRDAASVIQGFQPLANRTLYLKESWFQDLKTDIVNSAAITTVVQTFTTTSYVDFTGVTVSLANAELGDLLVWHATMTLANGDGLNNQTLVVRIQVNASVPPAAEYPLFVPALCVTGGANPGCTHTIWGIHPMGTPSNPEVVTIQGKKLNDFGGDSDIQLVGHVQFTGAIIKVR